MAASACLITLPTETLLEVATLLHHGHARLSAVGTPHPLVSLGLVCRKLFPIGRNLIFHHPTPLTVSNLRSRSQSVPMIGGWVRTLTVNLQFIRHENNSILASIMNCLSKMHDLTVDYEKESADEHSEFVSAICNYHSLAKLKVKERDLDLTQVPDGYGDTPLGWHFPDYLISNVLSSPFISLETLAHLASLPLHPAVFAKVQTHAGFQTLVFRASVQFNLRNMFNSAAPWGCANTLTKLVIRTCSGTNCCAIAEHVAAGVFGNLKRLSVITSGYEDSEHLVAKPPKWQIGVLDGLDVDHAADWEVAALSVIHVKEVNITRVFRQAIVDALGSGGWPELKALRIGPLEDETVPWFADLKRACEARNVLPETGAEPYGICHCHDE